ncbi:MAG: hypothetical protein SFU56_00250 [Capsulimonadales bacterium]|nr:hypothetical protein [Capsulimonadales bacterium]
MTVKHIGSVFGVLVGVGVIVIASWVLGLDDLIRESLLRGHLPEWVMGVFCLLWLLLILKAPWDLYFQAHAVAFEQMRSRERGMRLQQGREEYVRTVRGRLLAFAIGAHLLSAAFVTTVTYFLGGTIGYWFAGFYLVSTLFRPAIAGYAYLWERLKAIGQEARYPREDVEEMRQRLNHAEASLERYREQAAELQTGIAALRSEKEREIVDLNHRLTDLSHEFERTVARLTDNQEVIKGIQAFVRLISRSAA